MDKKTKIISLLLGITLCVLCFSCYKWYFYKQKCTEMQEERIKFYSSNGKISPVDYMVFSGNKDTAFQNCNNLYYGSGSHRRNSYRDTVVTYRDYILYCYIFAIRDKDSFAAKEFTNYYLEDLKGKVILDTTILRPVIELSMQILSDTSSNTLYDDKWNASYNLKEIYSGAYTKKIKDTTLYRQYSDSLDKYLAIILKYGISSTPKNTRMSK